MDGVAHGEVVLSCGVDAQNPWPGLVAFTEELQEYFHGRADEADDLLRRVNRKNVTVLFGQSGLGKTSLLEAGLFPLLRAEGFLPVAIRLDHAPAAPGLFEQVTSAVNRAILDMGGRCEAAPGDPSGTLWECFHRRHPPLETSDGRPVCLVLVFDQFEELFALGQANEESRSRTGLFLEQLADLIENRVPTALVRRLKQDPQLVKQFAFDKDDHRVLICFREDYLPHFESLRQLMPSVGENRMRLTRMNGQRALEAVINPGGQLITPEVGCQVVRFVAGGGHRAPVAGNGRSAEDGLAGLEVEPFLLSLVCRELNNYRLAQGLSQITSDLLEDNREGILQDFYKRCIADQPAAVRAFVEDELVTDSGLRDNIALEPARKTLALRGAPAAAIDELVKRRLLRLEERLGIQRVELTHDVLTPVVKESRDQRQQQEAVDLAKRQAQEAREKARRQRKRQTLIVVGMAALLFIVSAIGWEFSVQVRRLKAERTTRALAQVNDLLHARAAEVTAILKSLKPDRQEISPRLRELWHQPEEKSPGEEDKKQRMRIGMALLPMDPDQVKDPLYRWMFEADDPREAVAARDTLKPYEAEYSERLWKTADNPLTEPGVRFRSLIALADYDTNDGRWETMGPKVVEQLLKEENRLYLQTLLRALEPVREKLIDPLSKVFSDRNSDRRHAAASVLESLAGSLPNETKDLYLADKFTPLVLEADERQFAIFWQRIEKDQVVIAPKLWAELDRMPPKGASEDELDSLASKKANAAVTLLRLRKELDKVWKLLEHSEDPSVRTYIVHRMNPFGIPVAMVVNRLLNENPEISEKRALLLSLGEYPPEALRSEGGDNLLASLRTDYVEHSDAGIHSSVEWLLRKLKQENEIQDLQKKLRGKPAATNLPAGTNAWELNKQGQTFVIFPKDRKFEMGSREPDYPEEPPHWMQIPRSFAIGTKEVTVAQFQEFLKSPDAWKHHDKPEIERLRKKCSPDPDGPMIQVDWFWGAAYCNWLSRQEGLPESYEPNASGDYAAGMKIKPDALKRTGYRLPTEAEWEYACRAGAATSRFYGRSPELLRHYAWYSKTTDSLRTEPGGLLKPNDFGLFDVYGNVWEWCQDEYADYPRGGGSDGVDREQRNGVLANETFRILRGGAFLYPVTELRSGYRYWNRPATQIRTLGLRVARTCP